MSFLLSTSARSFRRIYSLVTPALLFIALFFLVAAWIISVLLKESNHGKDVLEFFLGFSALFFMGGRLITVHSSGSRTPDSIGDLADFFFYRVYGC